MLAAVVDDIPWLGCLGRLQTRWDRDSGRWFAFVLLACSVIYFNTLQQPPW